MSIKSKRNRKYISGFMKKMRILKFMHWKIILNVKLRSPCSLNDNQAGHVPAC